MDTKTTMVLILTVNKHRQATRAKLSASARLGMVCLPVPGNPYEAWQAFGRPELLVKATNPDGKKVFLNGNDAVLYMGW
jgi:hypothetical protein